MKTWRDAAERFSSGLPEAMTIRAAPLIAGSSPARALREVRAVAIIQKKMPDDWRAALTYLGRKHPKRWGPRMDVTSGDQPLHQPTGILVVPQRDPLPEAGG